MKDLAFRRAEAVAAIKKGHVVLCPTDTVYGFVADAANQEAVGKLFLIKKRHKNKPIPLFIKDIAAAKKLAFVNKEQETFLRQAWPGKVTVVLKRKKNTLPKMLFGRKKTIGLRIPDYPLITFLLKKLKGPLTATSANISGRPSSTKIQKVLSQFKNQKMKPDFIIDAGNLPKSTPSTVVDLTKKKLKILR